MMPGELVNRRRLLVSGGAFIVVGTAAGCTSSSIEETLSTQNLSVRPQRVQFSVSRGIGKLNSIRRARLLGPVKNDRKLQAIARAHVRNMVRTGRYGHSVGPGTSFATRINAAGFRGAAAENIAYGQTSIDEVMGAWLKSSGHRRNMLNRSFNGAGIAYAPQPGGGRYRHFWVLVMGRV